MFTVRQVIARFGQIHELCHKIVAMPFYAVRTGRKPGIYKTWDECKVQVEKFLKARYKKFNTEQEAIAFVKGFDTPFKDGEGTYRGSTVSSDRYKYSPQKTTSNNSSRKSPQKTSSYQSTKASPQKSPYDSNLSADVRLKIAEKEIEYLKEQLTVKEAEKRLLQAKSELENLKNQAKTGTTSPVKKTVHNKKPYDRSPNTSNSANWKQNRTTQFIDLNEARKIHTSAISSSHESDGKCPVVYTDGACVKNGQDGARAGIGIYWGPNHPLNTSERLPGRQTNNRAEIHAVVKAVQQARKMGFMELTVKTDSMFLINSMTQWLPGWKRKGWVTSTGNPVINREDFEALIEASEGLKINWVHVRGHRGVDGNEMADDLAVKGALKPEID